MSLIEVRVCARGQQPIPADRPGPEGSVLWVDVDPSCPPADAVRRLADLGVSVPVSAVEDLVDRDELPKIELHEGYRNVSAAGIAVAHADSGTVADLTFQMVEMLCGDGWVVTCWQHSSVCRGDGDDVTALPVLREEVVREVADTWCAEQLTTAGDLATAHVESITRRYKHAFRALDERMRDWEVDFHNETADASDLKPLLGMVSECRRRLSALNNNRSVPDNGRWFDGADVDLDKRANHNLDRMLQRLSVLSDGLRADLELVSLEQMARQARAAEESSRQTEQFDKKLSIVTAFLLVPTLIAGVFGANTRLPGGGTWIGFVAMVALMVVSGFAVWWIIFRRDGDEPRQDS